MKIAFIVPYPSGVAPSQRFRFEQYLTFLVEAGNEVTTYPFLTSHGWKLLYQKDQFLWKVFYTLIGLLRRTGHLFQILPSDVVLIHREASPLGPPVFEWIIKFILKKRIIFDFDDAIWLSDSSGSNEGIRSFKNPSKVLKIAKWSYKISAGNTYLFEFIMQFNPQVTLNPTTLDLNYHKPLPIEHDSSVLRLGWTGTHSTMKYLYDIIPVIVELRNKVAFELVVISNSPPKFDYPWVSYIKWDINSEIEDLSTIDIGLMPLRNDDWSKGKCGFKLLQYMSLEIPSIASPVGVNTTILSKSNAGKLCSSEKEWSQGLQSLIVDEGERISMGKRGRAFVETHYSVASNRSNFLSLFD